MANGSSDSPPQPLFVLVWREANSRRLRTYTNPDASPLASPLAEIFPQPDHVITDADELNAWLNSPATRETVAVTQDLARSELGWAPSPSPASPASQEQTADGK